jgi:hypothetical protein
MDDDSPGGRREGGSAAADAARATDPPRVRFRLFLASRAGGVTEAAWYLEQVMPRVAADPEARLAAEELLDHLARLMLFEAAFDEDHRVSVWTSPGGTRLAVALVDATEAVAAIGRAARYVEELRMARPYGGHAPAGLLCIVAGEMRRRPIEQLLEVRRLSQPIRIAGLASIVRLAGAVESGRLAPEAAAAVLEPGVFADALVALLAEPRRALDAAGSV